MKKNVLLTGATGGIGEAICRKLLKNYNLIIMSRNKEKLENFMKDDNQSLKNNLRLERSKSNYKND